MYLLTQPGTVQNWDNCFIYLFINLFWFVFLALHLRKQPRFSCQFCCFYFVIQKEYRKDLEESIRGKGLTEMEDTPDMLRAKNATQILNEVRLQPPTACTSLTWHLHTQIRPRKRNSFCLSDFISRIVIDCQIKCMSISEDMKQDMCLQQLS